MSAVIFLVFWTAAIIFVFELGARESRHYGLDSFDVPPPIPYIAKPGDSPDDYDG